MKSLYIYIAALLLSFAFGTSLAERKVSYARADQSVSFELDWGPSNYGTIQWQQSADGGATWKDIAGATSPT